MNNSRAIAAQIISQVLYSGTSLGELLPEIKLHDAASLIQALCYGTCRYYYQLDYIGKLLLNKPLKQKDLDIYALILMGIYQLEFMRIPAHAALSETVSACEALEKSWAKNFVNAILRRFQRERDSLIKKSQTHPSSQYAHPNWLINKIKKAWPENFLAIIEANNQQAPLVLRVNQQKISRDDYLKKLIENNIIGESDLFTDTAILLKEACDVKTLPGFFDGECSVQDTAAQLAATLLDLKPQQYVLDACAAPGGKTAHMLERQPDINLLAIDASATRLTSITENLQRLNLSAKVKCADVFDLNNGFEQGLFDRILLDAPCSATGVIRRHPDIKLLRRAEDIPALATTQFNMLKTLWSTLKTNGLLLYVTCSILPEENSQVIQRFLTEEPSAAEIIIDAKWGVTQPHGRQILTGENNMDGFYYCLLLKK